MLKFEFKDATPERKQEMLTDIISKYNVSNKNELIQALGHAQAVLECTQEEFGSHPLVNLSTRQIRTHKKEYLDVYELAVIKYQPTNELKDVDGVVNEDVLESVYQNLLVRLQSNKTSTKDIATILEYFGITANEFKQYATFRNSTMRAYVADNLEAIVTDEATNLLIKAVIAESPYLYQGTERTLGNTYNAQIIDLDNPLARLEAQTLGLMFMSLFNGNVTPAFVNYAETLRLLKLSAGNKAVTESSYKQFERMDGRQPSLKEISPLVEKDLIEMFGKEQGKEMFAKFGKVRNKVETKTAIKLPQYEIVADDYENYLKAFPELSEKPLKVFLARLDALAEKDRVAYTAKYQEFLEVNED